MPVKCCVRWLCQSLAVLSLLCGTFPAQSTAARSAQAQPQGSYRIHSGDKLSIKFLYQPELNEPVVIVRPDGFINLQMINDLKAAGLTVAELKQAIEAAFGEQLLRPEVSVSLIEFVAPRVFVGGQVQKPGSYELRAAQTVLQAVIVAGGFTRDASRRMVLHARPVGERELKVTLVDLKELLSANSNGQDSILADGDYVFVPDSKLSKFTQVVESFRFAMPGFTLR